MAIIFATATSDGSPITFRCVRGTRWQDTFQLVDQATSTPIDLTGIADIHMRVRKTINSAVLLDLKIAAGLTISGVETGEVSIDLSSAETNALPANNNKRARYVYDVVIERETDEYEPAISGKVVVLPQVTRLLDDA